MPPTYTVLKGISDISEYTLCDQLESNIIEFFNWSLLNIGAFFNSPLSSPESRLRSVTHPLYTDGQAWEPFRSDIVWESGISYQIQPIAISGVYINGTFYSKNSVGTYAHHLDYTSGRLIFDSPLPTNSNVQLEYSHRYFHFTSADSPWFREVMFQSFRVDDSQFTQVGSGAWSVLSENRVQLPSVVVETVPRRTFQGYQLGGGQIVKQDILFHIFTENPWDRKKLLDIISYQKDVTLRSFDKNLVARDDRFAFTETGALSNNALTYPQLIETYLWKNILFDNVTSQETISLPPLYQAVVRGTFEVIMGQL